MCLRGLPIVILRINVKKNYKNATIAGLISICLILVFPLTSAAKNPEQIFQWVADELEVTEVHPMPKIAFLEKSALQSVFKASNKHSRQQWQKDYGEYKANQLMQMYLKELVGLFDPQSRNVYIGNFIEPCRKEAVLAHELTHYFQVVLDRRFGGYFGDPGEQHYLREMEAYGMEKRYRRRFCEIQ